MKHQAHTEHIHFESKIEKCSDMKREKEPNHKYCIKRRIAIHRNENEEAYRRNECPGFYTFALLARNSERYFGSLYAP